MHFEGIVVHRIPYKDRDLIVKLLLRSGQLGSFYIYGGQGGGKYHRPTIFESGSLIKLFTRNQKTRIDSSDIMISAEQQRLWFPQFVRHDVKAFYLMTLYLELVQKVSVSYRPGESDPSNSDHAGLFSVVSNALYYLEDALAEKVFIPHQQLTLFLVKLLFHLGIMPDTDHCSYCQTELINSSGVVFLPASGQFACADCVQSENEKNFLLKVKKSYQTKFQDYPLLVGTMFSDCEKLINYFCHQYHLKPVELKSYSLLFQ